MDSTHGRRIWAQLWGASAVTLSVGVFVCLLVNYAVTGAITWALYPAGSVVLTLGIATPLVFGGRHRWLLATGATAVLVMPFLLLVERLAGGGAWAWSIGLPIATVSVAAILLAVVLFRYTRINRWYCTGITVLAALPVTLVSNYVAQNWRFTGVDVWNLISSASGIVIVGVVLLRAGTRRKRGA